MHNVCIFEEREENADHLFVIDKQDKMYIYIHMCHFIYSNVNLKNKSQVTIGILSSFLFNTSVIETIF